jgi:hypothetical protein
MVIGFCLSTFNKHFGDDDPVLPADHYVSAGTSDARREELDPLIIPLR